MENAPLRVYPGNFAFSLNLYFLLSTFYLSPIEMYQYICLCGLFLSSAIESCFFMFIFFFCSQVFLRDNKLPSSASPLRLRKNTPFLGFSKTISSFYHWSVFPKLYNLSILSLFSLRMLGHDSATLYRSIPEWLLSALESLLFSVSPVSFALSAQTKWRLVVSTPDRGEGWRYSNIRREGGLVLGIARNTLSYSLGVALLTPISVGDSRVPQPKKD